MSSVDFQYISFEMVFRQIPLPKKLICITCWWCENASHGITIRQGRWHEAGGKNRRGRGNCLHYERYTSVAKKGPFLGRERAHNMWVMEQRLKDTKKKVQRLLSSCNSFDEEKGGFNRVSRRHSPFTASPKNRALQISPWWKSWERRWKFHAWIPFELKNTPKDLVFLIRIRIIVRETEHVLSKKILIEKSERQYQGKEEYHRRNKSMGKWSSLLHSSTKRFFIKNGQFLKSVNAMVEIHNFYIFCFTQRTKLQLKCLIFFQKFK